MAIVPTIWKPDLSKSGLFYPDFKWFLTKWLPFVRISNGLASGFQIPFEIWIICNQTSFQSFEIQTSPDYRSPLSIARWDDKYLGYMLARSWQFCLLSKLPVLSPTCWRPWTRRWSRGMRVFRNTPEIVFNIFNSFYCKSGDPNTGLVWYLNG